MKVEALSFGRIKYKGAHSRGKRGTTHLNKTFLFCSKIQISHSIVILGSAGFLSSAEALHCWTRIPSARSAECWYLKCMLSPVLQCVLFMAFSVEFVPIKSN
ncbi:unnamed protein product [Citrullus colocynthis]|uniref:Uncharacterized protein n=1 Tax=Citrullus colocynthis TaxID=252529 RepID=A0ABP0Z5X7_9ROSI